MAIKKTIQIGSPALRKRSKRVAVPFSLETKKLIKDLADSMRHAGLIGMAAPQIGKNVRMFVTELRETKTRRPRDIDALRVFINPRVIHSSKKKVSGYEGCGSVLNGGIFGKVGRSLGVSVKALNEKGERIELDVKGLLAVVIQHENDHLDGILFIDKVSDTRTLISRDELIQKKKARRRRVTNGS